MTSHDWEVLVAEGIRLGLADPLDRWALGDLCLKAVPPAGTDRETRSAAQRKLAEFAAATGLNINLLKDVHRTSAAYWPPEMRIEGVSQAQHSKLAARPNRYELLLGKSLDDGLSPRVRAEVEKAERILADRAVREAAMDRSQKRTRAIRSLARVIQDEELLKAREHQRVVEEDAKARLAAPGASPRAPERAIRANSLLAKIIADLLELRNAVEHFPPSYHDRTVEHLEQVERAAAMALDRLRPTSRSPQPHQVIDMEFD